MLMNRSGLVTVAGILNDHEDELGAKFLSNAYNPEVISQHGLRMHCTSVQECIVYILDWDKSDEGESFWANIYDEMCILNITL